MSDLVDSSIEAASDIKPELDVKPEPSVPEKINWKDEVKGILYLVLAVLGFHSFIAKPFYIPSESMMPGLLVGDRLVVSKYPYGYSYLSPTFHVLPFMQGRLLGRLPKRGDVVIASPNGSTEDYIKRVIGLPGERIEVRNGIVLINGVPIKRAPPVDRLIPVDGNTLCSDLEYPGLRVTKDGKDYCQMPIVRETLPNGVSYDTIDLGYKFDADDFVATTIAPGHVFLMGDNRDRSADSRFGVTERGLGGAVPWENVGGRAEFITFSLDGSAEWYNPVSWFTAMRGGRAGSSLRPDKPE